MYWEGPQELIKHEKLRQLHPCCVPSPCWRIAHVQVSWDSWLRGNLQHPRITVPGHKSGLAQLGEENAPHSTQHRKHHPYTGCQHPEEQLPPAQVLPVALQFGWALLELHNQALIILLVLWWNCSSQSTPLLSHFASPFSTIPLAKVKPT